MTSKTVVVIEHIWNDKAEVHGKDVSVTPYVDGVCRLHGYDLFCARYVGPKGFDEWIQHMQSVLTDKDRRVVVYIAGHGSAGTIGGKRTQTVLGRIWSAANALNIEGCILGGCFAGQDKESMKDWMTQSSLAWIVGYNYAVDWLPSMMFDLSLIAGMLSCSSSCLSDRAKLELHLQESIGHFNSKSLMSTDAKEIRHPLSASVSCIIQPRRQCH